MAEFQHPLFTKRSSSTLSKKASIPNGNGYDDVFGGPPKFSAPSFAASRIDDYAEIFGNFYAQKAPPSIPVLDFPDDGVEQVPVDVRNPNFDYSEVFGGSDGGDFAVPYNETFAATRRAKRRSGELRKPADKDSRQQAPSVVSRVSSKERNGDSVACSETNFFQSNGMPHHDDGAKQFNVSYNKTNQGGKDDSAAGRMHITQLHEVSGFTHVVDACFPSQKSPCDKRLPQETGDLNGATADGNDFRADEKQVENNGSSALCDHHSHNSGHLMPSGDKSYPGKIFLTVSEINLQTQPSRVPPPSRLPPKLVGRQGDSKSMVGATMKAYPDEAHKYSSLAKDQDYLQRVVSETRAHENAATDSSLPFLDAEVDASSAAAASAAAMKDAMEKAEARIKSAKLLMERKRDNFHSRTKLGLDDNRKGKERREPKIAREDNKMKEMNQEIYETENGEKDLFVGDQRHKNAREANIGPDEGYIEIAKEAIDKWQRKERVAITESDKQAEGESEWKAEKQFYELVKDENFKVAESPAKANDCKLQENKSFKGTVELEKKEKLRVPNETYEWEKNDRKLVAVKNVHDWEEKVMRSEIGHGLEENEKTFNANHKQEENKKKLEALQETSEWVENEKKLKAARKDHEQDEIEKKLKAAQEIRKQEESEKRVKAVSEACEREASEKRLRAIQEVCEQEENEKRLKAEQKARECEESEKIIKAAQGAHEQEENEGRMKVTEEAHKEEYEKIMETAEKAHEQEENKKRMKAAQVAWEREENEKRLKAAQEAREREENEKRLKAAQEAREREENEKRLKAAKEAREQDENEKRLKAAQEAREREENERRLKAAQEAREREENERRLKAAQEAREREENEKRLKAAQEAREREENEERLKAAREREENERRLKAAREQEENEKRLKAAREWEENVKRLKAAQELEENEKRLKAAQEAREREESKKRLKAAEEAQEREENEKRLKAAREAWEREENERKLKAAQEAREQGQNEKSRAPLNGQEHEEGNEKLRPNKEGHVHDKNVNKIEAALGAREQEENCIPIEAYGHDHEGEKKSHLAEEAHEHHEKLEAEQEEGKKKLEVPQEGCVQKENEKETTAPQEAYEYKEEEEKPKLVKAVEQGENAKQDMFELGENSKKLRGAQDSSELEGNKKKLTAAQVALTRETEEKQKTAQLVYKQGDEKDKKTKVVEEACGQDDNKVKLGIGRELNERKASQVSSETVKIKLKNERKENEKNLSEDDVVLDQEGSKNQSRTTQAVFQWLENIRKLKAAQQAFVSEEKESVARTTPVTSSSQSSEQKEKNANETSTIEEKERSMLQREREMEMERVRKLEEEREREREREKDRIAVERANREARDRVFVEAREKAERAAVERATAEARQRAMVEARERAEKTSAEKASMEARLRLERAAVERATAEARERAVEKAMAERAALEARERAERSGMKTGGGMRQSSSFSDVRESARDSQVWAEGESAKRCKARLERHQRTVERAAKALAEKNMRDILAQREQAERNRLAETLDADVRRWSNGKEGNLRALLSTLQYILGPESGWQPIPLTDVITAAAVKKAYRKATLCVHPDKLQQRGASIQQKYICEKVFDLLKEAWNKFNSEER